MSNSLIDGLAVVVRSWPPRSPNLSPLDSHLRGYVGNIVYECKVDYLSEFSMLQDALSYLNESRCASKLTAAILNIYLTDLIFPVNKEIISSTLTP